MSMPILEAACRRVQNAGYAVTVDAAAGTIKVEGYAPMTVGDFLEFAERLRARRRKV